MEESAAGSPGSPGSPAVVLEAEAESEVEAAAVVANAALLHTGSREVSQLTKMMAQYLLQLTSS